MDSVQEPQGPLPREVYVRRRAIAGIVAVAVVLAVVAALFLSSRGEGTDTAAEDATPTAGTETSPAEETDGNDDPAGADATTTTETDDDEASRGRCDDEDLELLVWPAEPNFTSGDSMRFYMQVENTSDAACDRDLNEAPLSFEVYELETNSKVWSSIDCTPPEGEDEVVLQPGQAVPRQIDWSGRASAPGECSESDRELVGEGPYQVYALMGDVFSPAATFNIVEPESAGAQG